MLEAVIDILKLIIILVIAIVPHEYAHGWMANKLGDPTAKDAGRLTLNPLKHIDPFGTIILPGILLILMSLGMNWFLFGWAKPVPVNFARLNNPKRDMIYVAIAGPVTNILIAVIFIQLLKFNLSPANSSLIEEAIFLNLLLAIFNMVPIPPLDGSRVVMGLLPNRLAASYMQLEPYGMVIVFALLYFGLFRSFVLPIVYALGRLLGVQFS